MSLAWSSVKALSIPVAGVARDVKRITAGGVTLWEKPNPVPYDAEVEYLESTRTQYIDTGIYGSGDLDFSIEFLVATVPTSGGAGSVFGSRLSYNKDAYQLTTYKSNKGLGGHFNFGALGIHNNYMAMSANTRITASKAGLKITRCNGTSFSISSQTFTTPTNILLFALHENSIPNEKIGGCRIYRCSFSRNGTLVRDYIPVRVGSVGYLYDRANPTGGPLGNGLYPNSGSGEFVVGPDANAV